MTRLTLNVQEVAEALGVAPRTFLAARRDLGRAGFPRPLPGFQRPRWSRAQVEAWCAAAGGDRPPANDDRPAATPVDLARAALERRYGRTA